jgi:hypothetical protein
VNRAGEAERRKPAGNSIRFEKRPIDLLRLGGDDAVEKPVPICTAEAPSSSAAATPRASAMPPVATTGTDTASTIAGRRANRPTIAASAEAASKAPRWPPTSIPWATMTSAPARSATRASSTVVAVANQRMPRAFIAAMKSAG